MSTTGESPSGVPRKVATRRKLLDAARSLFLENGFAHVVVSDIPKLANVSQGTFYNHFVDKTDIFLAFTEEICDELDAYLMSRITAKPRDLENYVKEHMKAVGVFALRNPRSLITVMVDQHTLRPSDVNDPRLIDNRWSIGWASLLVAAKGDRDRKPTTDELMVGYTVQYIVRATFAFAQHEALVGKAITDRTAEHVLRILRPEVQKAAANDVSKPGDPSKERRAFGVQS